MVGWFADATPWTMGWFIGVSGVGSFVTAMHAPTRSSTLLLITDRLNNAALSPAGWKAGRRLADMVLLAPGEEPADGDHVGGARVPVADGGGEEFQETPCRTLAGIGDNTRHHDGSRSRNR
jgi:hypothetical protein